jgi:diguanylate cyclase (GGDEF)-like protein
VLPIWAEALLLGAAIAAVVRLWQLRQSERSLRARLQARERGSHLIGQSPEPRQIVEHAYSAACEILPISFFRLYRLDASQKIYEVWDLPRLGAEPRRPERQPHHTDLGGHFDPRELLRYAATETDRSFAPSQLLPSDAPTRHLHLPLYAGDVLVGYLLLASPQPFDESRKAEIRALLAPLTASLHASRNWEIAVTDELSGLYSRRYFETRFAEEWARHRRYGAPLTVALFDLDHFKKINDTLGHGAGDTAIRRFGNILSTAVRSTDLPCRYGGEEFAVLFPETPARSALAVADRVRRAVEREPFQKDGRPFRVTVSVGVADTEGLAGEGDALLVRADKALYYAKDTGRNRARLFTPKVLARRNA